MEAPVVVHAEPWGRWPSAPEEVEQEWLTECLRAARVIQTARVTRLSSAPCGVGEGLATRVVRIHIEYDDDEPEPTAPQTLVAKFPTAPHHSEIFTTLGVYEREVYFYRELAASAGLPVPRCYFAEYASESGQFVLLLEDLAGLVRNRRPAGGLTGTAEVRPGREMSVEQLEEVLTRVAGFHAAWWDSAALSSYGWLSSSPERRASTVDIFCSSLGVLEHELERRAPSLARAASALATHLAKYGLSTGDGAPRTLVHGDLHVNNLFSPWFGDRRFAVIDWQTVRPAQSGATDVARLIVSALDVLTRRAHQSRLLDGYHRSLSRFGVTGFTRQDLETSYLAGLAEQVAGQVVAMAAVRGRADSEALLDAQLQRIDAAVADTQGAL